MASKKRNSSADLNGAKKIKTSMEKSTAVSTEIDAPQSPDSILEFVSIKEEPVDISSPTSSQDRESPVDSSPKLQPKKSGAGKAKQSSVCEFCLRKCPSMLVVQFAGANGTNLTDGLEKVVQALGIQLEPKPFDVCRTCWQLVEIVATFQDSCLKAKDWRMSNGGAYREEGENDEWYSGKTAKAMDHALQIVQSNLDYFRNGSEKVLDTEDGQNESSFMRDELNVKDEAVSSDEGENLDETIDSQTHLDEYSNSSEKLVITYGNHPKQRPPKVRKSKIEIPTNLTPFPVYECTKCGRRFDSKNGLGIHMHHTKDSPDAVCKNSVPLKSPHCCTVCKLYYKSRALLKCHIDKHLGTKSLACRKGCGKMFYTGATLRVHEHECGTHRAKRLCPHCGLDFGNITHLNRHMNGVHSEESFPCGICGKLFKTKEAIARHMTFSHSTENTLSCNVCDKKYKNPDSLRVHMRLHTNEMPYGCEICGKRFRYGHAVRPHMLREHGAREVEAEAEEGGEVMEEGDGNKNQV